MTIEKLNNCTDVELKAMTDAQLLEYFAPVLHITRPDRAAREAHETKTGMSSNVRSKVAAAQDILKGLGIDL